MISNEAEYQEASARRAAERQRRAERRARLKKAGQGEDTIQRFADPKSQTHPPLSEGMEDDE